MSGKNRNRFESPLGVWTNPVYKTSRVSLAAKQTINAKLLHDWSDFNLPKLKPVEHISLMPSSCLSLTLMHARRHANKLFITVQPIRNLRTPASAEMNKRGFLIAGVPSPLSPIPLPFPLPAHPLFDTCYAGYCVYTIRDFSGFIIVSSLRSQTDFRSGREATTGNTSAVAG